MAVIWETCVDCNSKSFWKVRKPRFSDKNSNIQGNIMLLEKDKLLSKQKDVASPFKKHFLINYRLVKSL